MLARVKMDTPPTPDVVELTDADLLVFATARTAASSLKRMTFENWKKVGAAVVLARRIADAAGGHTKARRARARAILAEQGLSEVDIGSSRLLQVMDKIEAVESWRAGLTDTELRRWNSPQACYIKCPIFGKPKGPPRIKAKPMLVSELMVKKSDDIALLFYRRDAAKCWALYRSLSALLEGTPKPRSGWSRSREQAAAAGASAAAA
jgi:hypothetical protein